MTSGINLNQAKVTKFLENAIQVKNDLAVALCNLEVEGCDDFFLNIATRLLDTLSNNHLDQRVLPDSLTEEGKLRVMFNTGNKYKLAELTTFFKVHVIGQLLSKLFDMPTYVEGGATDPEENTHNMLSNAILKSRDYKKKNVIIIGDDSGIYVPSLTASILEGIESRTELRWNNEKDTFATMYPGVISKRVLLLQKDFYRLVQVSDKTSGNILKVLETLDKDNNYNIHLKNIIAIYLNLKSTTGSDLNGDDGLIEGLPVVKLSSVAATFNDETVYSSGSALYTLNFKDYTYDSKGFLSVENLSILSEISDNANGYEPIILHPESGVMLSDISKYSLMSMYSTHRTRAFSESLVGILENILVARQVILTR